KVRWDLRCYFINNYPKIFTMRTMLLCALCALVLFGFDVNPARIVQGTVTDAADGSALPGVNIALKGTSITTTTDSKGHYLIEVPESGGKLIFTFVGYVTREVNISRNSSNTIDVSMQVD